MAVKLGSLPLREEQGTERIGGLRRDQVMGGQRKQNNEELRNLCYSPSTINMIKSRRMRWAGHVIRIEENMNA
jgi:hypothetical protein